MTSGRYYLPRSEGLLMDVGTFNFAVFCAVEGWSL